MQAQGSVFQSRALADHHGQFLDAWCKTILPSRHSLSLTSPKAVMQPPAGVRWWIEFYSTVSAFGLSLMAGIGGTLFGVCFYFLINGI